MKIVHTECRPDETLLKKIGFTRKQVIHHTGKSRVFAALSKTQNQLALVDEDPGSSKTNYEKSLTLQKHLHGIHYYLDIERKNKIFILSIKLEDWIIDACKKDKINLKDFGFPERANQLHSVINSRLNTFERLLDHLLESKNSPLMVLKEWMFE